jgi:long-chain fatty acid transport protein
MKKLQTTLISLALIFALSTSVFANGLSLNSVGARALGMGGAFVGLANDATAIYWNPAGLAGQQSSILVFGTDIIPSATYSNEAYGIDATMKSNHYISPNAFFNYNMDKLSLAFGVYVPAGLGAEWDGSEVGNLTAPYGNPGPFNWMSKIGVINISPAIAYKVTDKFSVGLAVNIYYAMFDLERAQVLDFNQDGMPDTPAQYTEESTGLGFGATIGLKYDLNEKFSLGATFRTSTSVTMDGTAEFGGLPIEMKSDFDRDVTWPMWIAGGLAYHPKKNMTITLDGQYSNWSELDQLTAVYDSFPEDGVFNLDWENALQIRAGFEHFTSESFGYRVGYYYDPAPSPDETLNFLFPSSTNHVATGGVSYKFGQMCVTGGLEYLFGAEREIEAHPSPLAPENMPGLHQMDIFAFSVGFTYMLK